MRQILQTFLATCFIIASSAMIMPRQALLQLPPTQCVSIANAGGTGDDIQLPSLPCWPTTTLVILKITSSNTTTTPTISVNGGARQTIVNFDGTSLPIAVFQPGQYRLFTYNGSKWFAISQGANIAVTGVYGPNTSQAGQCAVWNSTNGSLLAAVNCPAINPLGPPFNCKGDGTTDDTACMQAAMDAAVNRELDLNGNIYSINSTGLTCHNMLHMVGTQAGQPSNYTTVSGFRPRSTNETILTIPDRVCNGSHFDHFGFDMGAAGTNTSGAAINMHETSDIKNITFSFIQMNRPCIGLEMNGNTVTVDHGMFTQISGSGCGGIRVGHYTKQGVTVDPRISNTVIQGCGPTWAPCNVGGVTTPADFGIRVEDSGGLALTSNDVLYTYDGTVVFPSGQQLVIFTYATDNVFGDTVVDTPLVIETGAPGNNLQAGVQSFYATNSWAAAYTSTTGAPGILISNTGSAPFFNGFSFNQQRVYSISGNGIVVAGSSSYGTVQGSISAGELTVSSTTVPIIIGSGVTGAGIVGPAIIGGQSAGSTGGPGIYSLDVARGTTVGSETLTLVGPQPTNFSLDGASAVCGIGDQYPVTGPANAGIEIGNGVHHFAIRNSTVSGNCDGASNGAMNNSIVLDGNNWSATITGNSLEGFFRGQAIVGEPIQPDSALIGPGSIIANNKGVDDLEVGFTAAATIDLGVYPLVKINGAATITQLLGCVGGQKASIFPTGGVNFASGGNISGGNLPYTPTSSVFVQATAVLQPPGSVPTCLWYLR